jgi:3-polyprenyl-4-hydroxybenzoate decarboxylase
LATTGAFTAFFATQILAAMLKSKTQPSTGMVIVCASVPILAAVAAAVLSMRARSTGTVILSGCGVLVLGTVITGIFVLALAA